MKKKKAVKPPALTCAFCGKRAEGAHSIHEKSGMCGKEVPLCNACGGDHVPTCAEIWRRIAWMKTRKAKKMVTRG